jgi:hypothetical protein
MAGVDKERSEGVEDLMEYNVINYREPNKKDIEAMKMWIEAGCVKQSYLEDVLGDVSIGVSAFKE